MKALHLGCGSNLLQGWVNIDIRYIPGIVVANLLKGIPYPDNSIEFIFTEHMLEHFTLEEGNALIKECYRVLKTEGVIRIVVPCIEKAIHLYQTGQWKKEAWIEKNGITTGAEFINAVFRSWGHQYIYDKDELFNVLDQVGFRFISTRDYQQSSYPELYNLENHNDLTIEAVK